MKKIIICVLMIVCCLFCFTACDNLGETYWKDTHASAKELFTSQDFDSVYNISFNNNINAIIAQESGSDYKELTTVFSPLFASAISYSYFHYEDLQISPKNNNNDLKNKIKDVNASIFALKNSINVFNQKKLEYESWVDYTGTQIVNQREGFVRLQLFKREYISLIEKAYSLSYNLFEARRIGYSSFSDYTQINTPLLDVNSDCDLAINASNLEILDVTIRTVRAYNAREVAGKYENYWQSANSYYTNLVLKHKNSELSAKENAKECLASWQSVYNMFKIEKNKYLNILEQLDLKKLVECENSASQYAKETNNTNNEVYVNYYLNFYQHINTLSEYSVNLFN